MKPTRRVLKLNVYGDISDDKLGGLLSAGLPKQGVIVYHCGSEEYVAVKRDTKKHRVFDIYTNPKNNEPSNQEGVPGAV